jgi:hypothetical protein
MTLTSTPKIDFVPKESIIAFVFIGVVFLVGLIARCLALNHSTIRSTQSLDLMIYQAAPKQGPGPKPKPSKMEQQLDSNSVSQDQKSGTKDSVTPVRIQRGPKNL